MAKNADEQLSAAPTGHDTRKELPASDHRDRWEYGALVGILVLAAFLRFWRLDQQGFGNGYYAATVRSMLRNPGNFFFGAFDPAGLLTVDKPPGALWVQALSAKLFGYHGLALLGPQALIGVLTVGLVYLQIRRVFGAPQALIAALVLAVNPISIAVDRDNLPDPLLTLLLTLAAGALIRSAESASGKWLLASIATVGAAFNVKMMAAFVVLPTFYLVYLLTAPATWFRKVGQLTAATMLLAAVSLSWSIIVDLTPENSRPHIGGSQNNSALNLALGYNGLGRVGGGMIRPYNNSSSPKTDSGKPPQTTGTDSKPMPARPQSGVTPRQLPNPNGGPPRAWRFAGATLSEQITWLFPLAFFGTWAGLLSTGWRRLSDAKTIAILIWTGWLLTHLVVFSFAAGIFHDYYTVVMGPAVAALVGIGLPALWGFFGNGGWRSFLLPTAFLATAAWQAMLIGRRHAELRYSLLPIVVGALCLGVALLVLSEKLRRISPRVAWKPCGAVIGCVAALVGPALWSLSTMMTVSSSQFPAANVAWLTDNPNAVFLTPRDADRSAESTLALVKYLRSQRNGESYLVAAPCCEQVQSIIIHTGETAAAIGGFLGNDALLTKEQFVELVESGKLRFMLLGGLGPGGMPFRRGPLGGENSEIVAWVKEHGAKVNDKLWDAPSSQDTRDSRSPAMIFNSEVEPQKLYDLRDAARRMAEGSEAETRISHGNSSK